MSIAQILRLAIPALLVASTAGAEPCAHRFGPQREVGTVAWWDQQLSIAACEPLPRIYLGDVDSLARGVAALEHAAAQSFRIYQAALAMAPAPQRLLAAYQLGQLEIAIVVRARAAVAVKFANSEAEYHARTLREALEPLLIGHVRDAIRAFATADDIAEGIPSGVPADPVVRGIVARIHAQLETIDAE